ncbi:MAG: cyclic nucleotide-binding domain-containing protein [Deltaproteobacteria bacterium]|nr:cyclic nucleotide-binding domain-containing protein [Deltaproteobacteria bacterium]
MEHLTAFRGMELFRDLTDDEIALAASLCLEETFKDGETILEEGVRATGLYFIVTGSARVLMSVRGESRHALAELHAGDHFGEMSLVTDDATAAAVRAEGETVCVHLPKDGFLTLLEDHPTIGRKMLWAFVQSLSRRLAQADRSLARALFLREKRAAISHLLSVIWLQARMIASYLWVWFRARVLRWPMSEESLSRVHRRNALRFKETAFRLKGANVKIGQLASMQSHILPVEYVQEFRDMRDAVPPTEYPLIASLIQAELGMGPLDLFDQFEKTPLAAASMAQVHVARLKTGEKVVVKVLHPGLERSVRIDLGLMRLLCRVLRGLVSKKLDLMQILREAEEPLLRELDLNHEAQSTETLARELAPLGVIVPRVHWRFTTRRVLTLDYIDGTKIDNVPQLKAWEVDREKLMATYLRAFLRQALEGGFFHADPHPGNVLCTRDGKLALLDFGMVKRLPDHVRSGLMKELFGAFFANPKLYVDGLIEKGAMGEADRRAVEEFAAKAFNDPDTRRMIFDHDVKSKGELMGLLNVTSSLLKGLSTFRTPPDNLMFMRALGIVTDVAREVLPEKTPSQIATPVLMPVFTGFLAQHPEYLALTSQAPPVM